MKPEYITIVTTLISVIGSLIVAYGTWVVQLKQARKKEHDEIMALLEAQRHDTAKEIRALQDGMTDTKATVQQQIAIIEIKIDSLSDRVEKHNSVIDRTYKLEQASALHAEQIKALKNG